MPVTAEFCVKTNQTFSYVNKYLGQLQRILTKYGIIHFYQFILL